MSVKKIPTYQMVKTLEFKYFLEYFLTNSLENIFMRGCFHLLITELIANV